MTRTLNKLNDKAIKSFKPEDSDYTKSDGGGLELRIKKGSSKLWVMKYTHPITKKRTNISFGRYPDVSLNLARKMRDEAKQLLAQNIDPKTHRDNKLKSEQEALSETFSKLLLHGLNLKSTT